MSINCDFVPVRYVILPRARFGARKGARQAVNDRNNNMTRFDMETDREEIP